MSNINDLAPGIWNIDASHSSVGFTARHLMITKVHGRFTGFTGTVKIAEDRLDSSVDASIDTTTVSTGDTGRDGHIQGPDFLDVATFPTMGFTSTGVTVDGGDYKLAGNLTIKGVTKPVVLDLEFDGVGTDPWGNDKAAFSASTEINRKDWGLEWNVALETGGVLVGEKVKLNLDIQVVKA
jgi:polyisoprenoid-binding protein YceI